MDVGNLLALHCPILRRTVRKWTAPQGDSRLGLYAAQTFQKSSVSKSYYRSLVYVYQTTVSHTRKACSEKLMQVTVNILRVWVRDVPKKVSAKRRLDHKAWIFLAPFSALQYSNDAQYIPGVLGRAVKGGKTQCRRTPCSYRASILRIQD